MLESLLETRVVREGSTLAIVAPSGPFDRAHFDVGVERLRARYVVKVGASIHAKQGYLAGSDERRLAELLAALDDADVDAIVCARGGYGATRLLAELDVERVRNARKLLVGFSDVTALHALWARAGLRSIHASMVAGLGRSADAEVARWIEAVEGRAPTSIDGLGALVSGTATGVLCGGNLAVLSALLGTPFAPPVDNTVLFLEDIGERPYRVDRMLTSMEQAGWFTAASAIVVGQFTDCLPGADGTTVEDVVAERLERLVIPVLRGVPAGHVDENLPLRFGVRVSVSSDLGALTYLE